MNKTDYNFCKFVGQFQVEEMAGVTENNYARAANASLDGSGVCVDIGNIGFSSHDQPDGPNARIARVQA